MLMIWTKLGTWEMKLRVRTANANVLYRVRHTGDEK
jgi:hypothetical protein